MIMLMTLLQQVQYVQLLLVKDTKLCGLFLIDVVDKADSTITDGNGHTILAGQIHITGRYLERKWENRKGVIYKINSYQGFYSKRKCSLSFCKF